MKEKDQEEKLLDSISEKSERSQSKAFFQFGRGSTQMMPRDSAKLTASIDIKAALSKINDSLGKNNRILDGFEIISENNQKSNR